MAVATAATEAVARAEEATEVAATEAGSATEAAATRVAAAAQAEALAGVAAWTHSVAMAAAAVVGFHLAG